MLRLKSPRNLPVLLNPTYLVEAPLLGKSLPEIPQVARLHKPQALQKWKHLNEKPRNLFLWDSRESMWVLVVILILSVKCRKSGEIPGRHLEIVDLGVRRVASVVWIWIGVNRLGGRIRLIPWIAHSHWMTYGVDPYCLYYPRAQKPKKGVSENLKPSRAFCIKCVNLIFKLC